MQYLSADPRRHVALLAPGRLTGRAWTTLVTGISSTVALGGGALAAASPNLAIVLAAGLFGAASFVFASSALALLAFLIVRGLTDAFATQAIVAGLNAGALVGVVLIISATAILVARLYEKTQAIRGIGFAALVIAAILYWFGIAVLRFGMDASLTRELLRSLSIVGVGLIAANSDRSITASRMGTIVVLAALIPALLVIREAALNWTEMVGGDFRPRGTMSHPNAAAILFGVAAPLALWKTLHDGGGVRYLWIAGVLVFATLLTRSMGGFAQLTVALLTFGALESGRSLYRAGLVAAVAALVVLLVFDPLGISRVSEFESVNLAVAEHSGESGNTLEWRLLNWFMYVREWQDVKLLGFGLGTSAEIVSPLHHLPHSDPVRFLVETGAVGVSFLLIGYAYTLRRLIALARRGRDTSIAVATLASLVGASTHSLATHTTFNTAPMYVRVALVAWVLTTDAGTRNDGPRGEDHPGEPAPESRLPAAMSAGSLAERAHPPGDINRPARQHYVSRRPTPPPEFNRHLPP